MQKAQEESRHLWQFAREVGLEVQSGGRVWITDLWDLLVNWYEGMGILDKEPGSNGKEKLIWHDLPNKYDSPVKAINQVASRFSEIFPKLQVCRYCERNEIERERAKIFAWNWICAKLRRNCKNCGTIGTSRHSKGYSGTNCGTKKYWFHSWFPQKPLHRAVVPMVPQFPHLLRKFAN
jgi:hypothetical protein